MKSLSPHAGDDSRAHGHEPTPRLNEKNPTQRDIEWGFARPEGFEPPTV
jgi:hypothetical protein